MSGRPNSRAHAEGGTVFKRMQLNGEVVVVTGAGTGIGRPPILNVASTLAHIGTAHMPVYCAAKGGVVSLTRQLAVDYGPKGLRVNSICPGPTMSPRVKGYFDSGRADPQGTLQKVMLGRF